MPTTNPMQFPGPMVSHLGVHKGRSTGIGYPLQTLTGACGPDYCDSRSIYCRAIIGNASRNPPLMNECRMNRET